MVSGSSNWFSTLPLVFGVMTSWPCPWRSCRHALARSDFKTTVKAYRPQPRQIPQYWCADLLNHRQLRSASFGQLKAPAHRLTTAERQSLLLHLFEMMTPQKCGYRLPCMSAIPVADNEEAHSLCTVRCISKTIHLFHVSMQYMCWCNKLSAPRAT